MATMIDTLRIARDFEMAGFAKPQAESLASAFADSSRASREELVTKDYLHGQIAELKGELRSEIAGVKTDVIRWMLATQALLLTALVAHANFTKLL